MTLKEFAKMLDGRSYGNEITKEEETIAKEHGFVVVFGYSDDNAELRGVIDDEIGCFNGGCIEHEELPGVIYANWCPEDIDCSWAYGTSIPHESFHILEGEDLYCVGIVCDISKNQKTNADRIRSMTDEELVKAICGRGLCGYIQDEYPQWCDDMPDCGNCVLAWLKQPYKEDAR